jgi:hypothetical protein
MSHRPYDPLDCIPSPDVIREKLHESLTRAERLRILLDLAERLRLPVTTADKLAGPNDSQEVPRA